MSDLGLILVVDDQPLNVKLLSAYLTAAGYRVEAAYSGGEAIKLAGEKRPEIILLDIMMPGLDGFKTCNMLKENTSTSDTPVIFISALTEVDEKVKAFHAGGVDYINKPFQKEEVLARVETHLKIRRLQKDLEQKNAALQHALNSATAVQKTLLPQIKSIKGYTFEWIFRPSSYLSGDTFNYFLLDDSHIGFYIVDVTGHGVPAALLSFAVNKALSPYPKESSPLMCFDPSVNGYTVMPPSLALETINNKFQRAKGTLLFFTMIYGVIDLYTDKVTLMRAGHVMPIYIPKIGELRRIEEGGLPIGLIPDTVFAPSVTLDMNDGDRLYLFSDGITECINKAQEIFTEERLTDILIVNRDNSLEEMVKIVDEAVISWNGLTEFNDDVTFLAIEKTTGERLPEG